MITMKIVTMRTKPAIHVYTPSYEHAVAAIKAGVTIISVNGPALGLRGENSFLTWEQINEIQKKNKQVTLYLRLNTVIHNQDIENLDTSLKNAEITGVAGIIYSDISVLQRAKVLAIKLPMFLETETTVTNIEMIRFWSQQGVSNFLLSRELSIDQIRHMIEKKNALEQSENVQFTVQVHGPIGIFHTLRPVLSNFNDYLQENEQVSEQCTNLESHLKSHVEEKDVTSEVFDVQGELALVEELRPNERHRIIEDARGTYIFSAYDISLYEYIPDLIELKIDMLKIDIFDTQTVESMVQVIDFYIRALERMIAGNFVIEDGWLEKLQNKNQYPIQNQFIKTGAPL